LLGTTILPYQALATRLDPKAVARLVEAEAGAAASSPAGSGAAPAAAPEAPLRSVSPGASDTAMLAAAAAVEGNLISIDEFLRVDLRVARARINC
jgi:hypothetical protein